MQRQKTFSSLIYIPDQPENSATWRYFDSRRKKLYVRFRTIISEVMCL